MAEAAAVGQIYRTQLRGRLNGQRIISTLDYRLEVIPAPTVVTAVYTFMNGLHVVPTALKDKYLQCTPTNYLLDEITYQCINPVRIVSQAFPVNQFGLAGQADTSNVSQSIEKRGEKAKRFAVGGMRPPVGTQPSNFAAGVLSNGQKIVLQALADELTNQLGDGATTLTLRPIVFNRSFIPNYTYIIKCLAKDTVRVMRRRTVGIGE